MTEIVVDKTIVERVAEAIWMENQPAGAPAYSELDFLDQGRVKMIARACIKAMREPTDEMLVAAEEAAPELSSFNDKEKSPSYLAWLAMIDAALKED